MKNPVDLASLLLRLAFGSLMLVNHGWKKMLKLFADEPIKFADPIGLGPEISLYLTVFAEVICAFLIIIGLRTRIAVVPLIITMLVAVFIIHIDDPLKRMESGILYGIAYIAIGLLGSGKYSVDGLMNRA